MKSIILTAMGISAVLLGFYIIIITYKSSDYSADYHIGCYLSGQTRNHHSTILKKLEHIKHQQELNRNYIQIQKSGYQLSDPVLREKSVVISKNVESYIQKLILKKRYQQANMEFFTELNHAKSSLQNCSSQINGHFDVQNCKSLWGDYQLCFTNYNGHIKDISDLTTERDVYMNSLIALLNSNPDFPDNDDVDEKAKLIKEKYYQEYDKIEREKDRTLKQLKKIYHQNGTKAVQLQNIESKLNTQKWDFDTCRKNLKEFRKCQEIAKALDQYGSAESFQNIEHKLKQKKQKVTQISELLIKTKKSGGGTKGDSAMQKLKDKIVQQYKELTRLLVTVDIDESKQCGCSEQQMKKLEFAYEVTRQKVQLARKEMNTIKMQIKELQTKVHNYDRQRQELLKKYQEQISKLVNQTVPSQIASEKAKDLQEKIKHVNSLILAYERKMNQVEFVCNQLKDQLQNKIFQLDEVTNCMSKKSFYEQLQAKTQSILYTDDPLTIDFKRKIYTTLDSINYPSALTQYNEEQLQIIEEINQKVGKIKEITSKVSHSLNKIPQAQVKEIVEHIKVDKIIEQSIQIGLKAQSNTEL